MKDTSPQEDSATSLPDEAAESIGRFLQRERLRQKKSLKEVAEATCIHVQTLQALEEETRSRLPAEVFVRGFISIYAQYLGLDVQEALNRYGRKTSADWVSPGTGYRTSEELPRSSARQPAAARRFLLLLILACLAALLAYGGYRLLAPRTGDLSSGGYQQPIGADEDPGGSPAADTESGMSPEVLLPGITGEPEVTAPESLAQDAEPAAAAREDHPAVAAFSGTGISASWSSTPPSRPAEPEIAAPPAPPVTDFAYRLAAVFTESTWLRIQIDDLDPAEFLFQPGERHQWKASQKITLFLGNAGGVDLTLNGQRQPKPGRSGQPAMVTFPGRS